jgi:hypothetical protein
MPDDVDDFEPVVSRLHSVAQQPMDHALEQRVLARAHRSRLPWLHSTKLKVSAALAAGFMIGSVSLASAGALPGPAQDVARAALGVFGVDVPPGHDRYNGPECGDVTNHGKYVEAHPDDPAAGKSPCGKPNRSVNPPKGGNGANPAGTPGNAGRHGPPPWAGQGKDKNKDKKPDNEDSSTTGSEPVTPANPVQPTTTVAAEPTTTTVAEEPTISTVPEETTATTSGTSENDTATTTESTTSATSTTAS